MSRALSETERALWERVAATVEPIRRRQSARPDCPNVPKSIPVVRSRGEVLASGQSRDAPVAEPRRDREHPPQARPLDQHGLDAGWDRRLAKGQVAADFTLDLHGCTLDQAHARLEHGLTLALSQGARVVLLVTGRVRPSDDHASRSDRRGAIRAKFLDWLAAGSHAGRIAAVRPAHPRHGGAGAVYLVLKRPR